ncbi:MAG: hypothetical protein ACI83B_003417 [Sediminicola sp.]|jgi:hypothetical protein
MTLKSINSFILKTFKHFRLFLVIFVLFKVSVCAENISFSKISKGNSVEYRPVASLSNLGIQLFLETEAESIVGNSQFYILPLSLDDDISKFDKPLKRSKKLSSALRHRLHNYSHQFFL